MLESMPRARADNGDTVEILEERRGGESGGANDRRSSRDSALWRPLGGSRDPRPSSGERYRREDDDDDALYGRGGDNSRDDSLYERDGRGGQMVRREEGMFNAGRSGGRSEGEQPPPPARDDDDIWAEALGDEERLYGGSRERWGGGRGDGSSYSDSMRNGGDWRNERERMSEEERWNEDGEADRRHGGYFY